MITEINTKITALRNRYKHFSDINERHKLLTICLAELRQKRETLTNEVNKEAADVTELTTVSWKSMWYFLNQKRDDTLKKEAREWRAAVARLSILQEEIKHIEFQLAELSETIQSEEYAQIVGDMRKLLIAKRVILEKTLSPSGFEKIASIESTVKTLETHIYHAKEGQAIIEKSRPIIQDLNHLLRTANNLSGFDMMSNNSFVTFEKRKRLRQFQKGFLVLKQRVSVVQTHVNAISQSPVFDFPNDNIGNEFEDYFMGILGDVAVKKRIDYLRYGVKRVYQYLHKTAVRLREIQVAATRKREDLLKQYEEILLNS